MSCVTILVNSCDRYEVAWEPFFRLLKIQWPQCEQYRIILNTETVKYNCDFLNVETVCGGLNIPWSKRLKNALSKVQTEYVLYFLEDFFLMSPVSNDSFEKALNLMREDPLVGYIGLKYNAKYIFADKGKEDMSQPFLNKDDLVKTNRVNSMTALWRKDWLESLVREHETPWEFEKYASIRSLRTNKKVLIINNSVLSPVFDYQVDLQYGYGISLGKWMPKNKALFEKYGIKVNYDTLGVYSEKEISLYLLDNERRRQEKKENKKPKDITEKLYIVKKKILHIPQNIKLCFRRVRSLV